MDLENVVAPSVVPNLALFAFSRMLFSMMCCLNYADLLSILRQQ